MCGGLSMHLSTITPDVLSNTRGGYIVDALLELFHIVVLQSSK
jgi:hypothetical protein